MIYFKLYANLMSILSLFYDLNHIVMISEKVLIQFGAEEKQLAVNSYIFKEGYPAHFYFQVQQGSVRLYNTSENGKIFVQGFFYSGESFGEPPLLGGFPYPVSAVTEEKTTILRISLTKFKRLLLQYPEYHFKLTQTLANRLRYKSLKLNEISTSPPKQRVLSILTYHKMLQGDSDAFLVPFTRKEIAMLTGLRMETVIRSVKALEKEEKLTIEKGKIIL